MPPRREVALFGLNLSGVITVRRSLLARGLEPRLQLAGLAGRPEPSVTLRARLLLAPVRRARLHPRGAQWEFVVSAQGGVSPIARKRYVTGIVEDMRGSDFGGRPESARCVLGIQDPLNLFDSSGRGPHYLACNAMHQKGKRKRRKRKGGRSGESGGVSVQRRTETRVDLFPAHAARRERTPGNHFHEYG